MESIDSLYPGNSRGDKSKKPRPKVQKIVNGNVTEQPQSVGRRVRETFTAESTSAVIEYLIFDVVIPNTKSLVMDLVTQGLEQKFYGGSRGGSSARTVYGYTPYNRIYKNKPGSSSRSTRSLNREDKASHNFGELVIEDRGEAELILDTMTERISEYDVATVFDLYELVGITADFTDSTYGWTDAREFKIRRVRNGYLLDLPKPRPID